MKRKKILFFLSIVIIIIIIAIIGSIIQENKPKQSINDFSSVEKLIEFDGHEFISMQNSSEEGYEKDIYLHFSKPTINDDGTINQGLYEIVISHVAGFLKGQNFRLIDQEKNILVKIQFDENEEVSLYTINDDSKYWEHIKTNYQIDNYQNEPLTSLTITSPILANIINANWIYNNVNLGTKDDDIDNYEIYFDEGYKIRKIGSEIFNIVFTPKYDNEILENITTSTNLDEVINLIGEPTYDDPNNATRVIGYKCEYFYIFFSENEISVYQLDKYNEKDSEAFGKLVTDLNTTGDMNTFLNRLTNLYPHYSRYISEENYINIKYPLQGFEVTFGTKNNNGITIYSNFQGYITEDLTIDDVREEKKIPANIYTKLDNNLVYSEESYRANQNYINRNSYDQGYFVQTNEYTVTKIDNTYKFYSRDERKMDSILTINNLTSMINYGETIFIFGVSNDGIYIYNAETKELINIIKGNGKFNITNIDNRTIYYDNTSINF